MKQQLKTKILAGFTLVVALLILVGVASWYSTVQFVADAEAVSSAQVVLKHLEATMSTLTDAETGQRGFVITGEELFLEPYQAAFSRIDAELGQLRQLIKDSDQRRRLTELEQMVAQRLDYLRGGIEVRRGEGFAAARERIAFGEGKRLHDGVRAAVAEMKTAEMVILREREDRSRSTARLNLAVVVAGGLLTLALVAVAWRIITHGFNTLQATEAELRAATVRAQAADRLKSAFLATMSHELRTPLNSIIGFTGIVLQGLAGPLNDEQRKQLGMVQGSSRHLLALINDVLDLSKIEAGELKVSCEPYDLRATLEKVAASVRPLAEKKGLALTVEIGPGIGGGVSDARRVEQVLLNLLSNAIKFTDRGTVTLSAGIVDARVQVRVTDTGLGIKSDDLATLFRPFQQLDTGLARVQEGTGLGLAICLRLAGLLGGEIHAESEYGKGSTFTFTLLLKGTQMK